MDGNDKHLETFRQEADELLGEIETVILLIEENPEDDDAINRLFRSVHTLKGSGGMFGLTDIANFSHGLESVLDKVRSKKLAISRELIDLTLAYRDQVGLMLHAGESGVAPDAARVEEIVTRLRALSPSSETMSDAPSPIPSAPAALSLPHGSVVTYRVRFNSHPSLFVTGTEPALLLDELRSLGECAVVAHFDDVPALEDTDPETCHLNWDIVLTTASGLDAIRDVFVFVEDICKIDIEDISSDAILDPDAPQPRLGDILVHRGDVAPADLHDQLNRQSRLGELLVESGRISSTKVISALSEQQTVARQQLATKNDSVRVPSDKLDALINLLGELVTNQARLSQIARNTGDMVLAVPVEEADRLTDELRDIVLNIRMMPIGTTFSRFKRLVRDLSGELDKQIELVTEGAETELDKTVIDRLADPLVHLIRNSIDHGVEHPDERIAAGKPAKGTIKLTAVHKGASVVISIIDDGKGLDKVAILKKAKEKGLVPPDVNLSDKEILALIFLPGFSTATKVTDVSGRGVGMDVVKREIDSLRGSIDIQSETGTGTRIDLALPLTLAIIEGLLVHVGEDRYVIPLSAIEECLELTADRFATTSARNMIQVRGTPVPLVRLRDIFGLTDPRPPLEQAVVVDVGQLRVGLVVDQVIGNHQTVIKSLGKLYRKADCISGATIMGDGNVALILDLAGIIRNAKSDEASAIIRNTEARRSALV
ncbi:chemotaxis protein CheA [Telmatospirillum sp.]|uniref:chemotaxis protein CheA n=1 Tax=Telmatospirillum sp. TaxID=2079197 RepID=UPI00284584D3|nr:chemotaxis protein CheA [Telmatospirillum sp.]MDR3435217.1 chemotaxis protein CheA [Telmatospirillum sp.]